MMTTKSIGETAVRFLTTLSGGPDKSLVTDDFGSWMSFRPDLMTIDDLRAHIDHIALPPVEKEVIGLVEGVDRVTVEIQGRCLLQDGRRYDNNYCFIVGFRGSLICEVREYCDTKLAADLFGGLGEPYKPE